MEIHDDTGLQGNPGRWGDVALTFEERRLVEQFQTILLDAGQKIAIAMAS